MRYHPNTPEDQRAMLEAIGASSLEDLFRSIPEHVLLQQLLHLPEPLAEHELLGHLEQLSQRNLHPGSNNSGCRTIHSFLGGGAYNHYIPAAVDAVISRGEFFTAYTPYQPEVSQGTLQAIFEFQTMISRLLGLDVANASMYDGATSIAEAALMALRINRKKRRVLVGETVHPEYRAVIRAYLGDQVEELKAPGGAVLPETVAQGCADGDVAAVVLQSPNFFGLVEDLVAQSEAAHAQGALVLSTFSEAIAFGVVQAPGACGADVAAGEGQSLGVPVAFGGPALGLFAGKAEFARSMPGRFAGEALDTDGRRGYVLTLSTREQHIRRERATSNICTNEGLCALMATVYLALCGRVGFRRLAEMNLASARYLHEQLTSVGGVEPAFEGPFFNEFVVRLSGISPAHLLERLQGRDILGGVALGRWYPEMRDCLLVTCTELNTRDQLDNYTSCIRDILSNPAKA